MAVTSVIGGKYYGPAKGYGHWLESRERAIVGTVRVIRGILFHAWINYDCGNLFSPWINYDCGNLFSPWPVWRTYWIPVDEALNTPENWKSFWQQAVGGETRIRLLPAVALEAT